jgi:hypothetical protein
VAKNYADIYNSGNDSIGLNQRFYAKLEGSRGSLVMPGNSDFIYTTGGQISFSQALEPSAHRTGRHHQSQIKKKKETSFSLSTYFNIDESLGAASTAQIDTPLRLIFESCFGKEETSPHLKYTTAKDPNITFSLYEVGDFWCRQSRGAFVEGCTMNFPGDGEATMEWTGNAKDAFMVGIGKSTVSNATNTVTLQAGEGKSFRVGAAVMLVKADGVTRSSDTPAGSGRYVTAINGDVVTLSGATLADADGATSPVYLSYYEPAAPAGINNPVTGLVGSMALAGVSIASFKGATITVTNSHELRNADFGADGLGGSLFVPGGKVTNQVKVDTNVNAEVVRLFNRIQDFEAQDFSLILGSAGGRHLEVKCPKVSFSIPSFDTPETGSVVISFEGPALQTGYDAADEISIEFK